MKEVRKHIPKDDLKKSWGYKYKGSFHKTGEFHGPNEFYWYGTACCKASAEAQGWLKYLQKIGIEIEFEEDK
jgi:hypothetical protein